MHQYRHTDKLKCERGVLLFFPRFDYYKTPNRFNNNKTICLGLGIMF